jgi:hypothetical protein
MLAGSRLRVCKIIPKACDKLKFPAATEEWRKLNNHREGFMRRVSVSVSQKVIPKKQIKVSCLR